MHLANLPLAADLTAGVLTTAVLTALALLSGLRAVRRALCVLGVLFLICGLVAGSAVFIAGGVVLLVIAWWAR